ncbi:MAG: DEAD/DEAH box helicase family protein [Candidatus Heimdallarchaeota archaeon]|nr:DEAD/DEAH box helicase family protein [Candidatus Heimdallarchaeota archaeon]MCK4612076.1 DEAD/DEAH box helicase family protein [Candidatus Heimdallarchaeota archaeon]
MNQTEYLNHPLIKPNTIEARLYQQTLFASCIKENSLVILPTGLGKTVLYLMITAQRLEKFPEGKIVFCAPTKPLLDQHERTTRKSLNIDQDKIVQVSGQIDPKKRREIWANGQVFITTPQTIQNDIIQRRVKLEEIIFLCLDEAHKAVGDHSYVFIAEQYLKRATNPLLLGITASPGSKIERINEVQSNLGITNIEMRDESSDDVRQYIHEIDESWEIIPLSDEFKAIIDTLNDLFKVILEGLKELKIIKSVSPKNNPRRELLQLRARVNEIYSNSDQEDRTEFFRAMSLVGNSIRLSHAIELIETQGIPSLSKYLEKQINEIKFGKGSRALKELMFSDEMRQVVESVQILQEEKIIHPKIERLKKIVTEELSNNPNNRILIFAHFRVAAKIISEELNKISGINSHWFVGQSSARGDKGLSQKEQIEIMQSFRDGTYNSLVSTSVAEEGLDIGECELVIFYDAVPSAIRLIQRKGRTGRRKEGKVIMLIAEGTRDEAYMWVSKRQTQKMKKLVKRLEKPLKRKETATKDKQKGIMDFLKEAEKISTKTQEYQEEKLEELENLEKETKDVKFVKEKGKIKVICDSRERNSVVIKELMNKDVELGFERLDIGDYICSDQIVVERKTGDDFIKSILDKRLFVQTKVLVESCAKPVMILEGDFNLFSSSLHPHALAGALTSLATDFRLPIIHTQNQKETAEILFAMARREQEERKRSISIGKRKGIGLKSQLEEAIASLPHVDHKISSRMLKHFGSVKEIMNAKLEDFFEVRGVGEKIASDIVDFIYTNYNEIETGEEIKGMKDELEFLKREKVKKEPKNSENGENQ